MTVPGSLLLCHAPHSAKWQVSRSGRGRVLLIGWADTSLRVDAGVPSWVVQIFAKAFTHSHRVSFPSTVVRPDAAELYTLMNAGGIWHRLTSSGPRMFALVTTARPGVAAEAFNDPGFPWWMQAQFALISLVDAPEPQITRDEILDLLSAPETAEQLLQRHKLVACLSPGVDGDVAALLTLGEPEQHALLTVLHQVAAEANVPVITVDENDFSERLAARA